MFPFMLFSTLFSSITTEPRELHWVCNSTDLSVWYSYCDNLKYPISLNVTPCVTLKTTKGTLQLSYIPRRDIKDLRFNLNVSLDSMVFPMRQEVVCRGSDGVYSFCRALKGETVNTNVTFSYKGINFFKGQYKIVVEAITGSHDDRLFCLNVTAIHESKFK
ncbi:lymphocyte antigen 96 [Tenrec ecaudatus]|uniref:lymphocyte antigen 96 n=1 Tax=Tenrec ecaudatus TaxID=94439 RepID=UPI003F5996DA